MTVKTEAGTAILCRKMKLDCIKVEMRKRPIDLGEKFVYPYNIERGGIATILVPLPLKIKFSGTSVIVRDFLCIVVCGNE